MDSKQQNTRESAVAWSPQLRTAVSLMVAFHLLAVLMPPLIFATRSGPNQPPSPAVLPAAMAFRPYSDAAYLNHGYAFFAPNPPGANSLLRFRVEFDDGRAPVEGVLPDLNQRWPRLFYHRHFMLSEQLSARQIPPLPEDATERERDIWRQQNAGFEKIWNSFSEHLRRRYDGDRVTLEYYDHRPPGVQEFLQGTPLDDPSLYRPRAERWREMIGPPASLDGQASREEQP